MNAFHSDIVLAEHAYLVARRVRPLALIGTTRMAPAARILLASSLQSVAAENQGAIPMLVDHADGTTSYGFAAEVWSINLYEWAMSDNIPKIQRCRIIGLLLGYSVEAIRMFEDRIDGIRKPIHPTNAECESK